MDFGLVVSTPFNQKLRTFRAYMTAVMHWSRWEYCLYRHKDVIEGGLFPWLINFFMPPWVHCTSGNGKFKMTFFIFTEWKSRYDHQEPQWTDPSPWGREQNGNGQNEGQWILLEAAEKWRMNFILSLCQLPFCESVVCGPTEPDINLDDDC